MNYQRYVLEETVCGLSLTRICHAGFAAASAVLAEFLQSVPRIRFGGCEFSVTTPETVLTDIHSVDISRRRELWRTIHPLLRCVGLVLLSWLHDHSPFGVIYSRHDP